MSFYREITIALISGAAAGAVVLGIVGRMATAGVAYITGNTTNLSLSGVLEILIVGTLAGTLGGLLLLIVKRRCGAGRFGRGAITGISLFASSLLLSWAKEKIELSTNSTQLFSLIVVVIIFIAYGVCADALLARLEKDNDRVGR